MADPSRFDYGNGHLRAVEVNGREYPVEVPIIDRTISPDTLRVSHLSRARTRRGRLVRAAIKVLGTPKNP